MTTHTHESGFIALLVVILVSAITVVYGLSIALMNADQILASQASLMSTRTNSWSSACVDNVLALLRNDTNLNGNVNVALSNVNCASTVTQEGSTTVIESHATTTDAFGRSMVTGLMVRVNTSTEPFTITSYKDILQ